MEKVKDFGTSSQYGGDNQNIKLSVPIQQLKAEHEPLLKQVQGIYDLVVELQQNCLVDQNWNKKYYQLYKSVVSFLSELKPHTYREDHFLYPLLNRYLQDDSGMIMVMDYEHKNAKRSIRQFIETVENRTHPLSPIEALSLLSCLEVAYFTIVEHFRKEEAVIFPLAEQNLSEEDKETLLLQLKTFG
ncbi:hemerythrin domain-containing protein [Bacillus sp. Marseille-P3661]|uniref:hemerythrin domain-containing protein n=1 Tax=Bacillus sp. Marseille-P3661 TaxID=1936234 RepID=UPI000C863D8A|nr:hemerythrin domain-containing protein [Bacillus sp. Marseille-P3661]